MHSHKFDALLGWVIVAALTIGVYPLYWDLGLLEVVIYAIASVRRWARLRLL
ncbi:MAG: hypothetical protein RMY28_015835 [Nostoc sp. ChiSLP01]